MNRKCHPIPRNTTVQLSPPYTDWAIKLPTPKISRELCELLIYCSTDVDQAPLLLFFSDNAHSSELSNVVHVEYPISPHLTISQCDSKTFNPVNERSTIGYLSNSWASCFYRAMIRSAVMRLHVVCLSVCPAVCNVSVPWSHSLIGILQK